MNVVEYTELLKVAIQGSLWKCRWRGEYSPYLHLPASAGAPRLYLSAGIHGDEPAGPMAVLAMLQQEDFFSGMEVFLFPVLNPEGLAAGTRENSNGVDLNRNFGPASVPAPETEWHLEILNSLPRVDMGLCLHEDWEASGVYAYHVDARQPQFEGRQVLNAMAQYLPLEQSCVIDGSNACEGLIARHESEYTPDQWPESIYLVRTKASASFTLETPSSAALDQRAAAHVAAVAEVIRQLRARESMN